MEIELLPLLADNYAYLLREPRSGTTAVVDPAVARPVRERLEALGGRLDLILATHHHGDHVGGIEELKAATGCRVIGPAAEADRIPGLDEGVAEGASLRLGDLDLRVLDTPGHTAGHISFWLPDAEALFCGDTLFVLGCGRILEGAAATMWGSLEKLGALPEATRVYCGHEYTLSNARFALTAEPENARLAERARDVERRRTAGEPTVPSTIGEENATNPFLRAGGAKRFAELRRQKDRF